MGNEAEETKESLKGGRDGKKRPARPAETCRPCRYAATFSTCTTRPASSCSVEFTVTSGDGGESSRSAEWASFVTCHFFMGFQCLLPSWSSFSHYFAANFSTIRRPRPFCSSWPSLSVYSLPMAKLKCSQEAVIVDRKLHPVKLAFPFSCVGGTNNAILLLSTPSSTQPSPKYYVVFLLPLSPARLHFPCCTVDTLCLFPEVMADNRQSRRKT